MYEYRRENKKYIWKLRQSDAWKYKKTAVKLKVALNINAGRMSVQVGRKDLYSSRAPRISIIPV